MSTTTTTTTTSTAAATSSQPKERVVKFPTTASAFVNNIIFIVQKERDPSEYSMTGKAFTSLNSYFAFLIRLLLTEGFDGKTDRKTYLSKSQSDDKRESDLYIAETLFRDYKHPDEEYRFYPLNGVVCNGKVRTDMAIEDAGNTGNGSVSAKGYISRMVSVIKANLIKTCRGNEQAIDMLLYDVEDKITYQSNKHTPNAPEHKIISYCNTLKISAISDSKHSVKLSDLYKYFVDHDYVGKLSSGENLTPFINTYVQFAMFGATERRMTFYSPCFWIANTKLKTTLVGDIEKANNVKITRELASFMSGNGYKNVDGQKNPKAKRDSFNIIQYAMKVYDDIKNGNTRGEHPVCLMVEFRRHKTGKIKKEDSVINATVVKTTKNKEEVKSVEILRLVKIIQDGVSMRLRGLHKQSIPIHRWEPRDDDGSLQKLLVELQNKLSNNAKFKEFVKKQENVDSENIQGVMSPLANTVVKQLCDSIYISDWKNAPLELRSSVDNDKNGMFYISDSDVVGGFLTKITK